MTYTRRDWGILAALAGTRLFAAPADSPGVRIGASTYSFRDLPHATGADNIDAVISALQFAGVTEIELSSFDIEPGLPRMGPEPPPPGAYRPPTIPWTPEQLAAAKLAYRNSVREWRLATPESVFKSHKTKFDAAGIRIYSFRTDFDESFTDREIESVFAQAVTMGAGVLSSTTSLTQAKRLAPLAEKHQLLVAFHTGPNGQIPDAIATPGNIAKALALSKNFRVNPDLGNFTALNQESAAFIQENRARITQITIKDRTRNGGGNEVLGEGDTPIKPILALLKKDGYAIPAFVEYEYIGLGTPREELKKSMAFARRALAG